MLIYIVRENDMSQERTVLGNHVNEGVDNEKRGLSSEEYFCFWC